MIPKYRAYVKREKEVLPVTSLQLVPKGVAFTPEHEKPYATVEGWCDIFPLEEIELMQSTGLLDKNGVEIFEGDIVKITNTSQFFGGKNITCYGEVRIIDGHVYTWADPIIDGKIKRYGARMLFSGMAKYIGMRGVATDDVKVIGNIYENPELIKNET